MFLFLIIQLGTEEMNFKTIGNIASGIKKNNIYWGPIC